MKLTLDVTATDGRARAGTVTTSRGTFRTPIFMPVGTRGSIRALMTHELAGLAAADGTQAEVVLGNTYHLMLRPGADVVADLGGLHRFTGWDGLMLTDSGGYQVFSLEPKLHDGGAEFRSTYDGSTHLLTPEGAVATQELLGADIQMVLDVCAPLPSSRQVLREALELTASWAARARAAHRRTEDQALFGIVQGGAELDLRKESARRTSELDFDGYAVGGLSVGETREEMLPALEAALDELPEDQPRYLMGVGDPVSIVESVARGIDMFDCVLPTRLARHGTLLTDDGRLNIKRAEFARSDDPVDAACPCATCRRYSRGYLRHLSAVGEPAAASLCSVHNLTWMFGFVGRTRAAIAAGTLESLRRDVAEVWSGSGPGLGDA
ncbi:tRNA guanosine(34) transglycosylase Tgt [Dermatobacter hominis]|uniref:tRNA guanosine(34) transglycosylase Tgt n=1 Tax=Dermatobacter hominis TaxID=2884263 RepID=UPI001D0F88C8|nr:tRNA guanosine(34) transglycosylase Tgt [Dermatobacter hominis]UDY36163.1 tRNA guanosine(34) transglycosylase Tgt [Dermatobacter hominis]